MDFELSGEGCLALKDPNAIERSHIKDFKIEGFGDLTAYVELKHEGDSVVAFWRLTFVPLETCH